MEIHVFRGTESFPPLLTYKPDKCEPVPVMHVNEMMSKERTNLPFHIILFALLVMYYLILNIHIRFCIYIYIVNTSRAQIMWQNNIVEIQLTPCESKIEFLYIN